MNLRKSLEIQTSLIFSNILLTVSRESRVYFIFAVNMDCWYTLEPPQYF